jgi:hypothetical protein
MRYYKSANSLDSLVKRQDVQILKHLPKNLSTNLSVENEGWLNVETGDLLTVLNQGYMIHARLTHPTYPLSCPFHHIDTPFLTESSRARDNVSYISTSRASTATLKALAGVSSILTSCTIVTVEASKPNMRSIDRAETVQISGSASCRKAVLGHCRVQ